MTRCAQLLYLAVRFRWFFGTAAVVALTHDVVIVIGVANRAILQTLPRTVNTGMGAALILTALADDTFGTESDDQVADLRWQGRTPGRRRLRPLLLHQTLVPGQQGAR
ncbi:hypothetical protein ADL28_33195 [Streptomyces violaceusniger]|uniref:Protein export membrane protein SecD/SecF C-terminal domain-containing protein n=1 Tax=Streptomyces violaceusniger TaxID=68280 RepID=A0A0X3VU89_STRVO|nr:hypothetical protein ADL28_33195 [Streptomyces violaceusniger]